MLGDGCEMRLPWACHAFLKYCRMPGTLSVGATPSRIAFMFASSGKTVGRVSVCWYRPADGFHSRVLIAVFKAAALSVYAATFAGVPTLLSSQIMFWRSS